MSPRCQSCEHALVEVGEEVDPERVLLVQLVAISILHSIYGMGRRRVLQEDVPERQRRICTHNL